MQPNWTRSGVVLGIALGGFFDGILLHQILQWHHLFSQVPGITDLRSQILWDGVFHGAMYLIAAAGLVGLWRAHRHARPAVGTELTGALLIGFGLWHVVDGVLSHWVLGLHRIRDDSTMPLAWDLVWIIGFGLVPLMLGWRMLRGGGPGRPLRSGPLTAALAILTIGAGAWAMRPPPDMPLTAIVFRAGLTADEVMDRLGAAGARLVWADPDRSVVIVDIAAEGRRQLYAQGALIITGSGIPAGCLDWATLAV